MFNDREHKSQILNQYQHPDDISPKAGGGKGRRRLMGSSGGGGTGGTPTHIKLKTYKINLKNAQIKLKQKKKYI